KTKKEAEDVRCDVITGLRNHAYIVNDKIKVKELLEYWLEQNVRGRVQSANSYVTYKNAATKHIVPYIGDKYIKSLTVKDMEYVLDSNVDFAEATVGLVRTVLMTAFNYAVGHKLMLSNPVESVKVSKSKQEQELPYHTRDIDSSKTLTLEQMQMLLEAGKTSRIKMQLQFNMLMGLRRQEINGLRYSDIDYLNHTLTVRRQLGKDIDRTPYAEGNVASAKAELPLKTRSSYRVLHIPDYVFESILEERAIYERNRSRRRATFVDSDHICCSSYGRPRSKDYHYVHFKQLLKDLGLPNVRWHDLRTSYTTLLLRQNFSSKAVSKLLGHATEIITVDRYGDNKNMLPDDIPELLEFIEEVKPDKDTTNLADIEIDFSDYLIS
ncbi:MAG: site-specific integrase, partial [Lachnoclostridium sp.]|nr:site-specific integrase [Lachnoclostridium sp.]